MVEKIGGEAKQTAVPEELRLGYKDELGEGKEAAAGSATAAAAAAEVGSQASAEETAAVAATAVVAPVQQQQQSPGSHSATPHGQTTGRPPQSQGTQRVVAPQRPALPPAETAWLDKAIIGVAATLLVMVLRMVLA